MKKGQMSKTLLALIENKDAEQEDDFFDETQINQFD